MMSQLSLDETYIVSIWLEVLLYGLYMALFTSSLYIVVNRRSIRTIPSKVMFCSMLFMFLLATIHVGVNLYRLLHGYVWLRNAPGGPAVYFGDISRWDTVFKDTIYATQSILGDALSIYRCWIIWEKKYWVVAFPVLLLVGSTVSGYIITWLSTKLSASASIFSPPIHDWIVTFYVIALVQKVITTFLIAYHIWRHDRAISAVNGSSSLMPIIRIVFESAALFVAAELILVMLYAMDHNAQYILLEAITPIVGIVFTSITVRLALRNRNRSYGGMSDPGIASTRPTVHFAMPPMTLQMSRTMQDKDTDDDDQSYTPSQGPP